MKEALTIVAAVLLGVGVTFLRFRHRYVPRAAEKLMK
jgi:hypothetical protein